MRVSVIIPTYNRADRLKGALNSVLEQSVRALEIIVIDDGSTDATREIVEQFATQSDVDILYLYQLNRGPAAARNLAIKRARGDWLAFLDSDDRWHARKLETQVAALQKVPDVLISHTRERWYRSGEHLNQKKKHQPPDGYIFTHCLRHCSVGMSTVIAAPAFFDKYGYFNESLRCCEDYDMWLRSAHAEHFLLVKSPLTIKHGGRSDQVSFQYRIGIDRFRIQSLASLRHNVSLNKKQLTAVNRELVRKCMIYGNGCIKHGKQFEGYHYLDLARYIEIGDSINST